MHEIRIDGRPIGTGHSCFVIAEAGVNHNGRTDIAIALVDAAHRAGADCVKFQTFSAERVASASAAKAPYQRVTTQSDGAQLEMLRALELPADAYPAIQAACREKDLVFLSTPYSPEDADFLESRGVGAYKVASAQIVELTFLRAVARKGRPILLSTGMATLAEIDDAVRAIRGEGNDQIVLLQCTTNYPSRVDDAHLRVLPVLRGGFGVVVGYSDHTESPACSIASIALGASVIEKHLTLDKGMSGPDHRASAEPDEFRLLVDFVREAERGLGSGLKQPTELELANRPFMRRSLVASGPIAAGTVLTHAMLGFKRPGTGISPAHIDEVIGTRARVPLEADQIIEWRHLER